MPLRIGPSTNSIPVGLPAALWRRQVTGESAEFHLIAGAQGLRWTYDVHAPDGVPIYSSHNDPRATIDVFSSSLGWTAPRLKIDGRTVALHQPHLSVNGGFAGRPYKILVPAGLLREASGATGEEVWTGGPALAPDLPVHVDPADEGLAASRTPAALFVRALDQLLIGDPSLAQAFRFVEIARRLTQGVLGDRPTPRHARMRAALEQPLKILVSPEARRARHSMRKLDYMEATRRGLVPFSTGGSCVIEVPLPDPGTDPRACVSRLVRSLLHEIAHHVHHFVQPSGIPYAGGERRHSIRDVRNAAFAYKEAEPQAVMQLILESSAHPLAPDDWRIAFGLALRRRRRWARRLLSANQLYRSELATGLALGALLSDAELSRSVTRTAWYAPVLSMYPDLAGLDARALTAERIARAIPPAENAYIKYQLVKLLADPQTSRDYLNAYTDLHRADRARTIEVIAHATAGLALSPLAGRKNWTLLQAQIRLRLAPRDKRRSSTLALALTQGRAWLDAVIERARHIPRPFRGDTRTPMPAMGPGGIVDLNRSGMRRLAQGLGLELNQARRIVRLRRRLRAGEFLAIQDLRRPPARALRPGRGPRQLSRALADLLIAATASDQDAMRSSALLASGRRLSGSSPGTASGGVRFEYDMLIERSARGL